VVRVGFSVEGDYFETCNCDVSCNCIWLGPATQDNCDLFLAWHITRGSMGDVDLAGLNAVLAVHAPKQMTDGNWRVALYLDDRATPQQAESLGAIFSGQAGGHLANLAPLIGEVAGVTSAPITFERSGRALRADVGDTLHMEAEELVGMDGESPGVIANPQLGAITQPVRQGRAGAVSYAGVWEMEFSGTNSFVTDFAYSG